MRADPYDRFATFARSRQPRLLRAAYLTRGEAQPAEDVPHCALVEVAAGWDRLREAC